MSIQNVAVNQLQKRLPKVIDARTHGFIDYAHSAFFFTVGLILWGKNRRAAVTSLGTSAFILVQSLLTDYPLGAKRIIPFAQHGQMDAGFASASAILPKLCGFSGTGAARIFQMNAVVEASVVGMTDWSSEHARMEVRGEKYTFPAGSSEESRAA